MKKNSFLRNSAHSLAFQLGLILTFNFIFLSSGVRSQNAYQPFFEDSVVLFNGMSNYPGTYLNQNQFSPYKAAAIDSVINMAGTTYYYPFKSARDSSSFMAPNECLNLTGNSWLGKYFFSDAQLHYHFINQSNDTIFIHTQENIGHNWTFYTYANGAYLKAIISSIASYSIGSTADSIKTIQLSYYDSLGNLATNAWSQRQLFISRNYGMVKCPHFNEFPSDSSMWTRKFEYTIPQTNTIYNFNVGDKFYYQSYYIGQPTYYATDYTLHEILNKNIDNITQQVFYNIKQTFYDYAGNFPNVVYLDTIIESNFTMSYPLNESMGIPEKVFIDTFQDLAFHLIQDYGPNDLNINEPIFVKKENVFLSDNSNCYTSSITPLPKTTMYANSLGMIYLKEDM